MLSGARRFVSSASGGLLGSYRDFNTVGRVVANRGNTTLADFAGGAGNASGGFSASSTIVDKNVSLGFLDGFLPHNDMHTRNRIFRDIYNHDPVCGAAVDIYSVIPFSDFTLKGIKDHEIMDKYFDCCEALHLKSMLPSISRDYNVMGKFIGSMFFDDERKIFTAVMPQNAEYCEITEVPIYGMSPLVDLKLPEQLRKLLGKKDPRVQRIMDTLPPEARELVSKGSVPLQPENTLYLPRRGLANDSIGTSFYERVLPWHLLEKTLTRGTIDIAQRRQHGILHITVTGDEDFVPSPNDLENVKNMFATADADPTGAIIVTRQGIMPSEVTSAGQFWRVDESIGSINDQKMKALGISEALLSGDSTYSCITGDSLISTPLGIMPIKKLADKRDGKIQDIDLEVQSHKGLQVAKTWLYNGIAPVTKVTLENGMELKATDKHPLVVLTDDGFLIKKSVKEAELGDMVAVPVNPTPKDTPLTLELSDPSDDGARNILKRPDIMTPDLAYFIGSYVAEGSCVDNNRVINCLSFSGGNVDVMDKWDCIADEVFQLKSASKALTAKKGEAYNINGKKGILNRDCYNSRYYSITLGRWMIELGAINKNPSKRRSKYHSVPWSILEADDECKKAYLAAYIDGDGSVSKKYLGRITLTSESRKLLRQTQVLLISLGVYSRLTKDKSIGRLEIAGQDADLLMDMIEPYAIEKHNKKVYSRKARNQYGFAWDWIRDAVKSRILYHGNAGGYIDFKGDDGEPVRVRGFRTSWFGSDIKMLYDKHDRGEYNTYLEKVKEFSPSLHARITDLLECRYRYVKIVGKKYIGEKPVYDLSMNSFEEFKNQGILKDPVFVANGMLTGNTLDASMSIFVEQLKTFRGNLTREIFYDKIFPTIAVANDFTKEGFETTGSTDVLKYHERQLRRKRRMNVVANDRGIFKIGAEVYDTKNLIMPMISWIKTLQPVGDAQYLDMLNTLKQAGIPVGLAAMATAGGLSIDEVLDNMDEDIALHKRIYNYQKKVAKYQINQDDDGSGGGFQSQAALLNNPRVLEALAANPSVRPKHWLNRDWDEMHDIHDVKKDGSYRFISKKGLNLLKERQAKKLSKVLANLNEKERRKQTYEKSQEPAKYHHRKSSKPKKKDTTASETPVK